MREFTTSVSGVPYQFSEDTYTDVTIIGYDEDSAALVNVSGLSVAVKVKEFVMAQCSMPDEEGYAMQSHKTFINLN